MVGLSEMQTAKGMPFAQTGLFAKGALCFLLCASPCLYLRNVILFLRSDASHRFKDRLHLVPGCGKRSTASRSELGYMFQARLALFKVVSASNVQP